MSDLSEFETLLRAALAPVDPPEHLSSRLEHALESITTMAASELESWELSAMRDPRKWVRPVFALLLGTGAGAALVLLRVRRRPPPARKLGFGGIASSRLAGDTRAVASRSRR